MMDMTITLIGILAIGVGVNIVYQHLKIRQLEDDIILCFKIARKHKKKGK